MNCHVVNKEGNALPDDAWHVSAYYGNIRNKVMNLDTTLGACNQYEGSIPVRMCNTPMRVRHHLLCSLLRFHTFFIVQTNAWYGGRHRDERNSLQERTPKRQVSEVFSKLQITHLL